jgi:hypothetical protein
VSTFDLVLSFFINPIGASVPTWGAIATVRGRCPNQEEGRWNVTGRGGKDVGIGNRRGASCTSPLARARGVREVSATCDSDGVAEADGSLLPKKKIGRV